MSPAGRDGAFRLSGRVALITGGNGGIGLGMAQALAAAGAAVVITGRDTRKLDDALNILRSEGGKADAMAADINSPEVARLLLAGTLERHGRLDILVNNAGMNIRKQPQDYEFAEWEEILSVNLTSAFRLCQAAYPALVAAGGGKIINVGSMMSIFGASFSTAYSASKGGLVQMSRSLASAWAKDNIQVNAVLPGWVDTDLGRKAKEDVSGLNERVLARTPAGRWGTAADFGGVAVFLASPESDFITGTAIPVDGGYSSQV